MSHVVPMRRPSGRRLRFAAGLKANPPPPAPIRRSAWEMGRREAGPREMGRRIRRCLVGGWFLGKALAIAVLFGGVWVMIAAAGAPSLRVSSILVAGNDLVPAEDVVALLPPQNINVFLVRGARLTGWLQVDPAIASARADPRLPAVIHLLIRERRPSAVWQSAEGPVLVDHDGLVLRPGFRSLPSVLAPEGLLPRVGERVHVQAVHAAEAVAPRTDAYGLADATIEFRPSIGVTLLVPGRYRVVVGHGDRLDLQLAAYDTVRRHLERTRTPAEVIDVRSYDRPFYR